MYGIALHKKQACLLNYIFHNSIVSKGIPGYPAEPQKCVNNDWQVTQGPIKKFKAGTSVLTAVTPKCHNVSLDTHVSQMS